MAKRSKKGTKRKKKSSRGRVAEAVAELEDLSKHHLHVLVEEFERLGEELAELIGARFSTLRTRLANASPAKRPAKKKRKKAAAKRRTNRKKASKKAAAAA